MVEWWIENQHRPTTVTKSVDIQLQRQSDYEQFCDLVLQDPYPLFDELRARQPVHWCGALNTWLGFRYDDALAAVKDPRLLSGRGPVYERIINDDNRSKVEPLLSHLSLWLQSINPPRHTRLRKLAGLAFTPRMIQQMVGRMEQIVADRLDVVREKGQCDFVDEFCYWVPATVICDMLGLPHDDHDQFRDWVGHLMPFTSGAGSALYEAIDGAHGGLTRLIDYFEKIIAQRRRRPGEDLISALVGAEVDGDRLSDEELFGMCVFLFVAGHETTMSLFGSATYLLLTHPDQSARFDPDDAAGVDLAIEECLRYESPVTRAPRVAGEDMTLRGQSIRNGDSVTFLLGAANRDPDQFDRADELDLGRAPNKHLAFGFGRHFCIGAELARLEARVAMPMIFKQLPNLQLADANVRWRRAFGIRSLERLQVAVR